MTDVDQGNILTDIFNDAIEKIVKLFTEYQRDVVLLVRRPTPLKITTQVQASAAGVIGGGFANPDPITIYQVPVSHEAWVHRISVSVPANPPGTPLTTGQALIRTSLGEPILFLPLVGTVAPVIAAEGNMSAAHVNAGERIQIFGDTLPANTVLRIDLQIQLTTGLSPDTPWTKETWKAID